MWSQGKANKLYIKELLLKIPFYHPGGHTMKLKFSQQKWFLKRIM